MTGLNDMEAFASSITEVDPGGAVLRYRGVDVEELVGAARFDAVWGLLVDDSLRPGLDAVAETPKTIRAGDPLVDLQCSLAALGPRHGMRYLTDIDDEEARRDLALVSSQAFLTAADLARDPTGPPTRPLAGGIVDQFIAMWAGHADPARTKAIEAFLIVFADNGTSASTLTARVAASTGASAGSCIAAAVGTLSGPRHGGATTDVMAMFKAIQRKGDAKAWISAALDRGQRIPGFGHAVYRNEDPRARILRGIAREQSPTAYELAEEIERAAIGELTSRRPARGLRANADFWAMVVLEGAGVPESLVASLLACARMAGWSAHILEQKRVNRLIRPLSAYTGHPPRRLDQVAGFPPPRSKTQL
jgi:citrate synthase